MSLFWLLVLGLFLCCPDQADAALVWKDAHDDVAYVVLEGEIVEGDYNKVYRMFEEIGPLPASSLVLRSPGGNYIEAIKIGTLLRKLKVGANIPGVSNSRPSCPDQGITEPIPRPLNPGNCTCLSSCAFIFIGAPHRSGEYLGLHRPFYRPDTFARLSPEEASGKYKKLMKSSEAYLKEMGVSSRVYELIMSSPSNRMTVLDQEYIKKFMWGWIPEIDEWILARCPDVPRSRKAIKDKLGKKDGEALTEAERDMLRDLADAELKVLKCRRESVQEIRRSGFQKVYGEAKTRESDTVH